MGHTLEIEAKGKRVIKLGDEEYYILFPFPVVLELEKKLGRPMRQPVDYLRMTTEEVPTVLEHGLRARYGEHAENLAAQVLGGMDAEDISNVMDFLCVCAFPKAMQRVEEQIQKLKALAEQLPKNVLSVAAC